MTDFLSLSFCLSDRQTDGQRDRRVIAVWGQSPWQSKNATMGPIKHDNFPSGLYARIQDGQENILVTHFFN